MADFRVENTTLTDSPRTMGDEPFVYQHMRVRSLCLPELAAHIAVAAAAAREIFGIEFRPDLRQTDSLCRRMLLQNRYPQELSSCIEMRLFASGRTEYRCGEIFAHSGLMFSEIRPQAMVVHYDIPFGDMPSSVRLEAHRAAMAVARRQGFRTVVRCNAQGYVLTAGDSPLFALFGRRIVTPVTHPSVERDRVVRAAAKAGYALAEEALEVAALRNADEIFYSDCRGITALSECDGRTLADIIARRIAENLETQNF